MKSDELEVLKEDAVQTICRKMSCKFVNSVEWCIGKVGGE